MAVKWDKALAASLLGGAGAGLSEYGSQYNKQQDDLKKQAIERQRLAAALKQSEENRKKDFDMGILQEETLKEKKLGRYSDDPVKPRDSRTTTQRDYEYYRGLDPAEQAKYRDFRNTNKGRTSNKIEENLYPINDSKE